MKPETINNTLNEMGMIGFENEIIAVWNIWISLYNIKEQRPSIQSDIDYINKIMAQYSPEQQVYIPDQTARRKILALKVSISNKQTVYVALRTAIERGIGLVNRFTLN